MTTLGVSMDKFEGVHFTTLADTMNEAWDEAMKRMDTFLGKWTYELHLRRVEDHASIENAEGTIVIAQYECHWIAWPRKGRLL